MGTTTNWAIRYPASTDDVRPYEDIQNAAEDTDAALETLQGQVPTWLARGSRATNGTTTTTTEQGFLRVDSIPIVSGRGYRIWTTPLIFNSSVAGDLIQAILRISTSGTATTASTQLTLLCDDAKTSGLAQRTKGMEIGWVATTTGNLSVLLSYLRASGTGNVNIQASSDIPAQLNIDAYNGTAPSNTGVSL